MVFLIYFCSLVIDEGKGFVRCNLVKLLSFVNMLPFSITDIDRERERERERERQTDRQRKRERDRQAEIQRDRE